MPQSQGRIIAEGFGWRHVGRKKAALAGLDLVIEPGEKVLLAGASGAGKSTFLHALAGVLPEESGYREGSLTVDGAAPDPRSGTCGLVLQDPDSQVILSRVADDVAFGMENLRVDPALMPARIAEALATVGLDLAPDHPTSRLSGGQKQRLALAGVLAMEPTVWLLDEPTANVDPESLVVLRDAILAAARDSTMLLVEHRLPLWIDHVDRLVVLGPEGVVADGEPRTLMSDPATRALLAESGVWLPDSSGPVARPEAAVPAVRPPLLLSTRDLAVRRPGADTIASFVPDLEIRAGEALALTGPNGAGKTTTVLTLGGLIPEASGEVVASPELLALEGEAGAEAFVSASRPKRGFLGRRARNASPPRPYTWTSAFLVPRIGSVFQEPEHQFLATTVAEELALGLEHTPLSPAERSARVDELLEVLGLTALARAHPHTLSGGQKRRLSVAAMIAPRPRILVIDEPTFGQDARTWEGLVGLIRAVLAEGTAVVTVSHDREFVAAIGAREVVLTPAGSTMSVPNGRPAA